MVVARGRRADRGDCGRVLPRRRPDASSDSGPPIRAVPRAGQAPVRPLGGSAAAIDVPPLDQSDPVVRELVKQITSHPRIAAWLTTDGLIRTFVVAVENIADGATPAGRFRVLRPASGFRNHRPRRASAHRPAQLSSGTTTWPTRRRRSTRQVPRVSTPRSSRASKRHTGISVSPTRPSIAPWSGRSCRCSGRPRPDSAVRLEPKGIGYGFVDPALEGLTGAQKQLLRTGPRNVRIIQSSLRQIALALGIPAERLPPPTP